MKDKRDYKFKCWVKVNKGYSAWNRAGKFRGENFIDFYILGLRFSWGMPYLHRYIYEEGFDAGLKKGNKI